MKPAFFILIQIIPHHLHILFFRYFCLWRVTKIITFSSDKNTKRANAIIKARQILIPDTENFSPCGGRYKHNYSTFSNPHFQEAHFTSTKMIDRKSTENQAKRSYLLYYMGTTKCERYWPNTKQVTGPSQGT